MQAVPFHEYTVSFLAYLIWDPVHMYNCLLYTSFVKAMTSGGPNGASDVALSYMYSQKDAGLYGYSMAIGVVIFLFSFALSACVNKVTNRDTLEF